MKYRSFGATLALIGFSLVAAGCSKQDPATATERDSTVDRQTQVQAVQNNPKIPPQAQAQIQQQIQAHGGYSNGPKK